MGMFDEFYAETVCPKCGKKEWQSVQTKQLPQPSQRYVNVGAFASKQLRYVDALAECRSCSTPNKTCPHCKHFEQGKYFYFRVRLFIDEDGTYNGKCETLTEEQIKASEKADH